MALIAGFIKPQPIISNDKPIYIILTPGYANEACPNIIMIEPKSTASLRPINLSAITPPTIGET